MTTKRTPAENIEIVWQNVEAAFLADARARLQKMYLPWICQSLEMLSEEDIWWRPNPHSNSAGNLVLHLCGNIRQWVITGLTGADDQRQRDAEFAPDQHPSRAELIELLQQTLQEVDQVLEHLSPDKLLKYHTIQGFRETGLTAIFHAVEHFSYHTGQIAYIAKLRGGKPTHFYDDNQLNTPKS